MIFSHCLLINNVLSFNVFLYCSVNQISSFTGRYNRLTLVTWNAKRGSVLPDSDLINLLFSSEIYLLLPLILTCRWDGQSISVSPVFIGWAVETFCFLDSGSFFWELDRRQGLLRLALWIIVVIIIDVIVHTGVMLWWMFEGRRYLTLLLDKHGWSSHIFISILHRFNWLKVILLLQVLLAVYATNFVFSATRVWWWVARLGRVSQSIRANIYLLLSLRSLRPMRRGS